MVVVADRHRLVLLRATVQPGLAVQVVTSGRLAEFLTPPVRHLAQVVDVLADVGWSYRGQLASGAEELDGASKLVLGLGNPVIARLTSPGHLDEMVLSVLGELLATAGGGETSSACLLQFLQPGGEQLRRFIWVGGRPALALRLQGLPLAPDVSIVAQVGPRPSAPPVDPVLPLPWHRALPLLGSRGHE